MNYAEAAGIQLQPNAILIPHATRSWFRCQRGRTKLITRPAFDCAGSPPLIKSAGNTPRILLDGPSIRLTAISVDILLPNPELGSHSTETPKPFIPTTPYQRRPPHICFPLFPPSSFKLRPRSRWSKPQPQLNDVLTPTVLASCHLPLL